MMSSELMKSGEACEYGSARQAALTTYRGSDVSGARVQLHSQANQKGDDRNTHHSVLSKCGDRKCSFLDPGGE